MPGQKQDRAVSTEASKLSIFENLLDIGIPTLVRPCGVWQAMNTLSRQPTEALAISIDLWTYPQFDSRREGYQCLHSGILSSLLDRGTSLHLKGHLVPSEGVFELQHVREGPGNATVLA